ncbi:MAG: methyltransferase domain-containing protein [Chloroflexia bacterium]|nr:methyltransferase domain-containing protein [Chloroflexia bacterium]
MRMKTLATLDDMKTYYDQRAAEYDDWWLGRGLYAALHRPGWHEEVWEVERVIADLPPAHTLDVACGTGFLTRFLRGHVAGLDQSERMIEIAARRVPGGEFVVGDGLALPFAADSMDRVLSGHFYGHLNRHEGARFLAEARRVASELVIVDAALRDGVEPEETQERVLKDGSRHQVYKRYFDPAALAEELGGGTVLFAGTWFVAVVARLR